MPEILLLSGGASPADRERCRELAEFLRRRARRLGEEPAEDAAPPGPNAAAEALAALAALENRGLLSSAAAGGGVEEVLYTPSREALRSVFEAGSDLTGGGFPEPVHKKQLAAFRTSQGALFRFPLERGDGALEVFITDWSPCPAACAVAVHRSHPFAASLDEKTAKPEGSGFTGRYVRHPLTGDLLPVWVADWVRPDFGTGAVLVNPAHDATDLAFGRQVGLPIRFALVPAGYDGSPATWPQPPVVKTGQTVRTGPWDGLPAADAAARYFEVLAERGLAERYRDIQAGRWPIGRRVPDETSGVRFETADLLVAALAAARSAQPVLVCPAGEQAGELLAVRLLAQDLAGRPLAPAAVHLVQKVQESKVEAPPEVVRLAILVGAPLQQVAVIKQQTIEQVQRFLRVHQELHDQAMASGDGAAENPAARALAKIEEAVGEADPAKAFSLLQQTQKQLRDLAPEKRSGALPGYFALAEVVAGLAPPPHVETGQAWKQIQ